MPGLLPQAAPMARPKKQKPRRVSSPGFLIGTSGSGRQYCRYPEQACAGLCVLRITDSRPWHSRSFPVKIVG
ncbi:hypothetical protein CAter282_0027 [Collimonas arenae]|uniref:Uncharacterized protein n=1 Tax=Collimonas arenae TaxID=279058 RepID=A0A127PJM7_9BURK|nr:hypothetical protein CAter10_0027 [Collimonas arenae]AMP07851.1 hypothetical protein CAter282_0027 [Collimonas arenae]